MRLVKLAGIDWPRDRKGLPACWPVLAPLALLGLALILRIIDVFVLRLDERLGEIILSKALGFARTSAIHGGSANACLPSGYTSRIRDLHSPSGRASPSRPSLLPLWFRSWRLRLANR